jgi:uncharacterized coiled-coil DUF342 family protein
MNPAISRCCTCGAEWLTGEDGSHSCAVHLNRQLAKAREERDKWKQWHENTRQGGQVLAANRDAALAKLAKCREALEHIARYPHITATAMRDCARETLEATK